MSGKNPTDPATVKVDAKQLHAALGRAVGAVDARKEYPILQCVLLYSEDDELVIVASDNAAEVSTRIPLQGTIAPICVESARLLAIAAQIKDRDEVAIRFEPESCIVTAGRSRFTLSTMEAGQFPRLSLGEQLASFTLGGAQLADIFSTMAPAISSEQTRHYLNGICLQPGSLKSERDKDHLVFVATDGHKLYARHIEVDGVEAIGSIIVPRVVCAKVAKLFGDDETVSIVTNSSKVLLQAGATTFLSRLVEGTFPDWRRVAGARPPTHSFDTADLIRAVDAASAATGYGKNAKGVKLVVDGDDETTVEARDKDNPGFTGIDACPHSRLTDKCASEIGVSGEYLVEMLRNLNAETAELALDDAAAPIIITGATFDDRRLIIMPMRV